MIKAKRYSEGGRPDRRETLYHSLTVHFYSFPKKSHKEKLKVKSWKLQTCPIIILFMRRPISRHFSTHASFADQKTYKNVRNPAKIIQTGFPGLRLHDYPESKLIRRRMNPISREIAGIIQGRTRGVFKRCLECRSSPGHFAGCALMGARDRIDPPPDCLCEREPRVRYSS